MRPSARRPSRGGGYSGGDRGGYRGGFPRGPGFRRHRPWIVSGPQFIDDGFDDGPPGPPPQRRAARRAAGSVPAANERRLVPDEVLIEVASSTSPQAINALQRRHRLTQVEQQTFQLAGTTLYRWRIPDRRSVANVVRSLQGEAAVASVQPNYLFTLQNEAQPQDEDKSPASEGDPAQYELAKLHLPQAHDIAKGDHVLVGVIDSAVDAAHPELAGSVAQSFDAVGTPLTPHDHGTAIAGLIAAHGKLMGAAPDAQILAVRAFDPAGASAEGTTFNILKGLDWAAANGARVINMSFAGPADPDIHRSLEAAHKKGIVLIAAAGNAGAVSPPLYPAADANVIAVSATDAEDHLFAQSNRGRHIAIAAPGTQILVASAGRRLPGVLRHVLFRRRGERHRRAAAAAQTGPQTRPVARHSDGERQGPRSERPRQPVRRRTCRCLWRADARRRRHGGSFGAAALSAQTIAGCCAGRRPRRGRRLG